MGRNAIITSLTITALAIALFTWITAPHLFQSFMIQSAKDLPNLTMRDVQPGQYNLTILVPNVFGRKYHTKPVTIDQPFQISRYEITNDQWNLCFADGACSHKAKQRRYQKGNHPVTRVSWFDAFTFTKWLSENTGQKYRLPTEEEWAYVAVSGEDFTKQTIEDLIDKRIIMRTTPLGRYRKTKIIGANGKNSWEVADMTGPVWEWTMTCWFSSDEENLRPWTIAQLSDPNLCPNRVVQGDERAHVPYFVDEVYTGGCGTGAPVDHIGFRVVREI